MPKDRTKSTDALGDRKTSGASNDLRIRAAWLYYIEGMTQSDVAEKLGVSRIMITRLLSDAKRRGEVVIRIQSPLAPLVEMQNALEKRFGLARAIIAPLEDEGENPTRVIASAAGVYVTQIMENNLTVGVGWGHTLHTMLQFVEGRPLEGVRVVSLLGGIAQARRFNPAEFAWQFAELFDAEGYLISAPALVDSVQTRHALLEHCGLEQIFQMAEGCDVALLSCGGISTLTTSYRLGHVSEAERNSLVEAGAVGDLLYNFLDKDGLPVDHPVNDRSIAMPIERLKRIPNKVLISGGAEKVSIIRAVLNSVRPSVLITDEATAKRLLDGPAP
ncbi:sugar-binding transcriptional regulator [Albidovulum sediminicola]|uniref:Sugar-binding transcriptional regulator n=1 Tax=Albidovulum sediminicola TaxID=2984331 RepID=A0ABT2Z6U0_9RHOB|nr:sugar-binding transcriptional regulator [Defluviimonas sp. WL0075]MCV2866826.1 sugar-binding transcriptional regulator [Defluviimonas sp. WL0075]